MKKAIIYVVVSLLAGALTSCGNKQAGKNAASTLLAPRLQRPKKKPMPAPPSKRKSKIGNNMIRYSLAVPYGGGQLR